jgi:hypothetical protein
MIETTTSRIKRTLFITLFYSYTAGTGKELGKKNPDLFLS